MIKAEHDTVILSGLAGEVVVTGEGGAMGMYLWAESAFLKPGQLTHR